MMMHCNDVIHEEFKNMGQIYGPILTSSFKNVL